MPALTLAQVPIATTPTIPPPAMDKATPRLSILHPDMAEPAQPAPGTAAPTTEGPELSLGECIAIAVERQPTIRAAKASQAASEAGVRGLNNIGRIGSVLSPDLHIRKQQATRGLAAVCANVQRYHNEVVQDTTRLYYTVVYADQQLQIAEDGVAHLEEWVRILKDIVKGPMAGTITNAKVNSLEIGLATARDLRGTALAGKRRAMAALREIMAVDDSFVFRIKDKELPLMKQDIPLTRDQVVEMALSRRPEMALASAAVDAFRLEVYAQGETPFRRAVPTFASGADIHAEPLPTVSRDKEYRPGAIFPEMPTQLVGTKYDRVCRAIEFSRRADAVFDKTRNLVVLEATDTLINLERASDGLNHGKDKFNYGKLLSEYVIANFAESREKDSLVTAYVVSARAKSEYLESVLQYLISLSALERVTAGAVRPNFPGR